MPKNKKKSKRELLSLEATYSVSIYGTKLTNVNDPDKESVVHFNFYVTQNIRQDGFTHKTVIKDGKDYTDLRKCVADARRFMNEKLDTILEECLGEETN